MTEGFAHKVLTDSDPNLLALRYAQPALFEKRGFYMSCCPTAGGRGLLPAAGRC